jgi:5'-deoxynucleotidase
MFHFFAMLSRMKYINRWGLMRNTRNENISEHSLETAVIAHALAEINVRRLGGNVSPERIALLAVYHDVPEILTGDLPTPVKYHSPKIREAYAEVEEVAVDKLVSMLPDEMKGDYRELMTFTGDRDAEYEKYVKAADKISAVIKCIEEKNTGNREFDQAEITLRKQIDDLGLPEAGIFMKEFLPSYMLTLDDQN